MRHLRKFIDRMWRREPEPEGGLGQLFQLCAERDRELAKNTEIRNNLESRVKIPEECALNIHDICLELSDITFKAYDFNEDKYLIIEKPSEHEHGGNLPFDYNEAKDAIDRIKDYMNSEGYETKIETGILNPLMKENRLKYIIRNSDDTSTGLIKQIRLSFYTIK